MQSHPLPFNFDDFIMAFYGKQMWNYFNACASNFYACFTYDYDNPENCEISEQGKLSSKFNLHVCLSIIVSEH